MVQSSAADVAGYLAEVPEDRRPALTRLRELCRTELAGFTEVMAYGMPAYERPGGVGEVAWASQKRYISFYLLRSDVLEAFEDRLAGLNRGKGCIRFRRADAIDFDLVRDLLRATAAGPGPIC
ncbi:iron chaperone [Streptomyces inhibens]|uniref:iron chaperone n=1 Tax=Streptomyces inhibens TaxID=2293571 RepID=UPI003674E051